MNIAAIQISNEEFSSVRDITRPALEKYCARHGYTLLAKDIEHPERSIVWDRYRIIKENLANFDAVVHFDADVLITNHHIRLEEFLNGYIVISRAETERGELRFNDGVALFMNRPETFRVLDQIIETPDDYFVKCGQDAMERLYCNGKIPAPKFERQQAINAFDYRNYGMPETTIGQWVPGSFVLHLPGCSLQRRTEIFNETLPKALL